MLEQLIAKYHELEQQFTTDLQDRYSQKELKKEILHNIQNEFNYPILAELTPEQQLQLARDYNALENPTDRETVIMLSLDVDENFKHQRRFNHQESAEIMAAFAKCADNIAPTANSTFKHNLSLNIRSLVRSHPETARFALGVYDQTLNDIDVIDCIRCCMSYNDKLIDKGFAVMEKNINNLQKNCSETDKKDLTFLIDEHVRVAFADLYGFYASNNADITNKITNHFTKFNKYMSRRSQLGFSNTFLYCDTKTPLCDVQRNVLYATFKAMADDERPFAKIYAQKLEQHKDELEQAVHKEKVWRKSQKKQHKISEPKALVLPNSLRYNLIHAGKERPTAESFCPITNGRTTILGNTDYDKPSGGLWCSLAMTTDGDVGQWEDFCNREYNEWLEAKFKGSWHIVPGDDCRILECHTFNDIRPYLHRRESDRYLTDDEIKEGIVKFRDTGRREVIVDYEAIAHDYDLLLINDPGFEHPLFGTLSCDSGIVMDFNKVKVLDNQDYAKFLINESKRFATQLSEAGIDHTSLKQPENIGLNKRIIRAHFTAQKGSDAKG